MGSWSGDEFSDWYLESRSKGKDSKCRTGGGDRRELTLVWPGGPRPE